MTTYPVKLLDVATNALVDAELHDEIAEKQLCDWQFKWQPTTEAYIKRLTENGIDSKDPAWPQSWHWDWRHKMSAVSGLLGHTGYSVTCSDVTQGMMRLDLTRRARLPKQTGSHLVYVDYLEVAPWNWRNAHVPAPTYRLVGPVLMHAAFTRSIDEGFKGRLGLHSLPQAISFYERCSLTNLGTRPEEYGGRLPYFEATPDVAAAYLSEET